LVNIKQEFKKKKIYQNYSKWKYFNVTKKIYIVSLLTIIILLLIADWREIRFDDRVGNDLEYGDCCFDF
jgi:hypothetical protein